MSCMKASNELDCYLDAIVRTSMSVANTSEGAQKERIVLACQEVWSIAISSCSNNKSVVVIHLVAVCHIRANRWEFSTSIKAFFLPPCKHIEQIVAVSPFWLSQVVSSCHLKRKIQWHFCVSSVELSDICSVSFLFFVLFSLCMTAYCHISHVFLLGSSVPIFAPM